MFVLVAHGGSGMRGRISSSSVGWAVRLHPPAPT
jgi:hypothetical protein